MPARIALALVVLIGLAGCGFELRGSASLPTEMSVTRVETPDPTSPFVRELELLLDANGVDVVDDVRADAAVLRIVSERITRRALTVSGDARVREYELVFALRFSLDGPEGNTLIEAETLRLTRDFQFDELEILGASNEEELLREDLRRNMAASLIRRLEAFGRS